MRRILDPKVERARVLGGPMGSDISYGNNGLFVFRRNGVELAVIASNSGGWEHVSVSLQDRTPTWQEMCYIKDLFWHEEEAVMQIHPPVSRYVKCHPHCLHMWSPIGGKILLPPLWMIGPMKGGKP